MKKILSFVIPCYRSENTITQVVNDIQTTVNQRSDDYDYEIILICDHSPDNVFSVITQLALENEKITGIDLSRNFGQHSALMAGFHHVTGDIIVCMDDDGQTPANQMFKLIDALDNQCDVVFAQYDNKKHSLFRNFGSAVNDLMARILIDKPKDLKIMSYFACKRYIIDEIKQYHNPYPYVGGLLLRTSKNIKNVTIHHQERMSGTSGYTLRKLLALWVNGFTSFSVKPLRISTFIGFLVAVIGGLYGIYTIIKRLFNPNVPIGYSSQMSAILFIGGMIMIMLGIIGEYVGRIYISLNNSPQFIIREIVSQKTLNDNDKDKN